MVEEFNPMDFQMTQYQRYKQDLEKFNQKIDFQRSVRIVQKTPDQFSYEEQQEYIKNEFQRQQLVSTQINLQNIQKKIVAIEMKRSQKQKQIFEQEHKIIQHEFRKSQVDNQVQIKSVVQEVMNIDVCDLINEDRQTNNMKNILQQQVRQIATKKDIEIQVSVIKKV